MDGDAKGERAAAVDGQDLEEAVVQAFVDTTHSKVCVGWCRL